MHVSVSVICVKCYGLEVVCLKVVLESQVSVDKHDHHIIRAVLSLRLLCTVRIDLELTDLYLPFFPFYENVCRISLRTVRVEGNFSEFGVPVEQYQIDKAC